MKLRNLIKIYDVEDFKDLNLNAWIDDATLLRKNIDRLRYDGVPDYVIQYNDRAHLRGIGLIDDREYDIDFLNIDEVLDMNLSYAWETIPIRYAWETAISWIMNTFDIKEEIISYNKRTHYEDF